MFKKKNAPSLVQEKIEEFFVILNLKCPCCDTLNEESAQWGIHTIHSWESAIDQRLKYLRQHREVVLLNLADLRKAWPDTANVLEALL